MGRGIVRRQPRLRRDNWEECRFCFSSVWCASLHSCTHFTELNKDVLSKFDERDTTAARSSTREKARELCSEQIVEGLSSNSSDLTGLHIGIPQVCQSRLLSFLRLIRSQGILSRFVGQLHHLSLSPRSSRLEVSWCDRATGFSPQYPLCPQRILRHR